jgi:hypothetical protein
MTDPTTKAELLQKMEEGWNTFHAYVSTLTPAQLTEPKDAAGWSAKDHLIHLAVWQDGVSAVLEQKGETRPGAMGLDAETWAQDFDAMNAVIQQQNRDLPVETVLERLRAAHTRMFNLVSALPEEALFLPYKRYDPSSKRRRPIIGWIVADSYAHYAEHTPWIQAIVAS